MKNLLSTTLALIFTSASVLADQVFVFEGVYRLTPPRDANLSRSERVQRCFLVVDVAPGTQAQTEVFASVIKFGVPNGIKQQSLLRFEGLPRLVGTLNNIPVFPLNRLDPGGSVILGYANRTTTNFAFQNDFFRLKGDFNKLAPENRFSSLKLPRSLSGSLMNMVVDDIGVFPPGFIGTTRFNEASLWVVQNSVFTSEYQRERLSVVEAITRLGTYLEGRGYGALPK